MENKKLFYGIVIILCILVIALSVFYTYSRYVTQTNGLASAQVAKWSFDVKSGNDTSLSNIKLTDTSRAITLTPGKIAPGSQGSFDIVIDATGCDTALDYTINFLENGHNPKHLVFKKDGTLFNLDQTFSGTILANDEKIVTMTIEWDWPYSAPSSLSDAEKTAYDEIDTNDGKTIDDFSIDIKVTGTQVIPS